eukprot:8982141-Prorocentrum_lima.AAC.1
MKGIRKHGNTCCIGGEMYGKRGDIVRETVSPRTATRREATSATITSASGEGSPRDTSVAKKQTKVMRGE